MRLINKPMKRLSLYLFLLLFTLQTPSLADDIRDFQIEGMSIGDSLLDYFSEEVIKKNFKDHYNSYVKKDNKKYRTTELKSCKFSGADKENCIKIENYDGLQVILKRDDKKYIVMSLAGVIDYRNNIKNCYEKKDEIFKEIKGMFKNLKTFNETKKHPKDTNSNVTASSYIFPTKDYIRISCTDWSKKIGYKDNLRIAIISNDIVNWLKGK